MNKKMMCLCMAAGFLFGGMNVYAEESAEWTVTFDGKKLNDSASDNTVLREQKLLPGDTIIMTTTLKNTSDEETNWYIDNEGIEPLTKGSGSFEYSLTYNERVIIESKTVASDPEKGLEEVELDGFTWLGTLKAGETGKVNLKLTVDGEVQGNTYFNDAAKLYEVYAVETVQPEVKEKKIVKTVKKVNTGDNSGAFLYVAIVAFVIAISIILIAVLKKKKEDQES